MPEQEDRLETKLIKDSWVSPPNFIKAKEEQAKTGKSLYSTLIKLGFLSEERVYEFFSQQSLIPFVRISDYRLDPAVVKIFPENSYRENYFLPLFKIESVLYVCLVNPLDTNLLSTIEMQANCEIFPLFASSTAILNAINSFFGPDDKCFNLEDLIVCPQTAGAVPFWRESDRLTLKLEIEIKPDDERIRFVSSSFIPATAWDISFSGKAMGVKTILFIPPTTKLSVRFPGKDPSYEAKAEVVRCNLEKGGKYFLGVRFIDVREDIIQSIVKTAQKRPGDNS